MCISFAQDTTMHWSCLQVLNEDVYVHMRNHPPFNDTTGHLIKMLHIKVNMGLLTLFANILRFLDKECSDKADVVYSLPSFSQDGHRLRVDYGTSSTERAQEILRLYEDDICSCLVLSLTKALLVNQDVAEFDPGLQHVEAMGLEFSARNTLDMPKPSDHGCQRRNGLNVTTV
jgi:hypothetical protein